MIILHVRFTDKSSNEFLAYFSRIPCVGEFIVPYNSSGYYRACRVVKVLHYPCMNKDALESIVGVIEVEADKKLVI